MVVERYNRTIFNSLRGYMSERQNDWDEITTVLTFGYNCRIHSSLGYAPFELVLSRPPPSLSVETPEKGTADTAETARALSWSIEGVAPIGEEETSESPGQIKSNI
jgi:hypothetical protein